MPNLKISQLPELVTPADTDVLPIVDAGTNTTKKIQWSNLLRIGGSDTSIQYNDGGDLGGDSNLTWNKTTKIQTVKGLVHLKDVSSGIAAILDPVALTSTDKTITFPDKSLTIIPWDLDTATPASGG